MEAGVSYTLYDRVCLAASRDLTRRYSTSFSLASKSFPKDIRQQVYNIYGIVRLADEIVDTYGGDDSRQLLDSLEAEVYASLGRGYSSNTIVHAFMLTARQYGIGKDLLAPFFASMAMDAPGGRYTPADYKAYIHGSAEVVGLMCLRVFCGGDPDAYRQLRPGAMALGAAFQKVNFLRDLSDDHARLGRFYFPKGSFEAFDEAAKQAVIADIRHDLEQARPAIRALPSSVRPAVATAAVMYGALLEKLEATPADTLRQQRVRIGDGRKLWLFARAAVTRGMYP
jgi:15-cis-phytoene synthase